MKLLIITQKMKREDSFMGFFHSWTAEFAKKFDAIEVICLEAGANPEEGLPKNVTVFSLGKEREKNGTTPAARIKYTLRFLFEIIRKRNSYDAVFVHMNQEYILVGGWFWKLAGKRIYMWRNHHAGTKLTDIAAAFCTNVFCTSKFSYTAKYKKTIFMPVGIDTNVFKPIAGEKRIPNSILFLARIAPIKRPDLLVKALANLKNKGLTFTANFYGDPLPKDIPYYEDTKQQAVEAGLGSMVAFHKGIPNDQAPAVYRVHEIFVNLSSSGMYDKTIFEAMACGALVLASNKNLNGLIDDTFIFEEANLDELTHKLDVLLGFDAVKKAAKGAELRTLVEREHSLAKLSSKLAEHMS